MLRSGGRPCFPVLRSFLVFMTRSLSFLLAGIALCAVTIPAQAEPLTEAVVAALNHHPRIEAAFANRDALEEERLEKRSDYFPQLSVGLTGGRLYGDNSTSRGLSVTRGAGYSGLGEGNVALRQMIFDGFQTTKSIEAAEARRDSARLEIADLREKLALEVATAYLDVLRGRESLAALQGYGKTIDDYIGRIEKMVKEGAADSAMAEQARDIRAQLRATIAASEGQLQLAYATYVELTGAPPQDPLARPDLSKGLVPAQVAEAVAHARAHHPALRAAKMTEESYGRDAEAERAAIYPDITGEMSYLKRDQEDIIGGESIDARATVRLNWDYAVGGAYQARVRRALHRREESRAQYEEKERMLIRAIESAYSDARTAAEQARIQKERVRITEGILGAQRSQFEAAKVNILQLLQSENAVFNAKLSLMSADYREMMARMGVLASMGRLQEALNIGPVASADSRAAHAN